MRKVLRLTVVSVLTALSLLSVTPAMAAQGDVIGNLTVLATTDMHGVAIDYDYFTGKPFAPGKGGKNVRGMDHLATAIKQEKAQLGDSMLLLDNGDTVQGSPLDSFYQKNYKKLSNGTWDTKDYPNKPQDDVDPIVHVLKYLGYDAMVTGNHEYNFGIDYIKKLQTDLNAGSNPIPLLAANVVEHGTTNTVFTPYVIIPRTVGGQQVKVGVLGLVTPGVRVWDKNHYQGIWDFQDIVKAGKEWAPKIKAKGADVVIALVHSGLGIEDYPKPYDESSLTENVAKPLAEASTDIDMIVAGHSHVTNQGARLFTNAAGKKVLLTQPYYHARSVAKATLPLVMGEDGHPTIDWNSQTATDYVVQLQAKDYEKDPGLETQIKPWVDATKRWVQTVVATSTEQMKAAEAFWKDEPIIDFINYVQAETVKNGINKDPALKSQYGNLPVISQASPFNEDAVFKKGPVTIADMAALYIYDNTLYGVKINGKQIKAYLEWSARYYKQLPEGSAVGKDAIRAQYPGETRPIPDYSYDMLSGVDYHIDISKPVGHRIDMLEYKGKPIADNQEFVLAINNYRLNGGSGYMDYLKKQGLGETPVVYDGMMEIREGLINWAVQNAVIDPKTFADVNWSVSAGAYVKPTVEPSAGGKSTTGGNTPAKSGEKPQAKPKLSRTGANAEGLSVLAAMLLLAGASAVVAKRMRQ